jgi:hypothetical protein
MQVSDDLWRMLHTMRLSIIQRIQSLYGMLWMQMQENQGRFSIRSLKTKVEH